ncbi:MAG: prephenate dehydrogenase, partial [Clostridiaceae bacterium]|nr:prephenate dehydrogenase [Clostridiaceae bacterium]
NSLKQQEGVRFLEEIARVIGSNPVVIPIDKHDSILAYTSHLMHAVSCALVLRPQKNLKIEYTAGAFRDMTRIADINPVLWTQLFLDNKENVLIEIDKFMENMLKLKRLIENDDEEGLKETLGIVRNNKLTIFEGGKEDGS